MLITSLASRFGRKPAFFLLWFILVASVICESVAKTWQVWFVAKLFSGIGVGSLQFVSLFPIPQRSSC